MAYFKNLVSIKSHSPVIRPRAELVTIGTELVTGTVLNTNASYLGRELTRLGFWVHAQTACPDDARLIQEALAHALRRSDVIFVSGGLGPTPDDITRECVAEFFQVPLVLSQTQYRQIVRYYRKRKRKIPTIVKREAYFPANAWPVFNKFGIALGFVIEDKGRTMIVLPGVPGELVRLFESKLKPYLRRKFPKIQPPVSLVVKTIGVSEPTLMQRLGRGFFRLGNFQFGIYPEVGEVALRIYTDTAALSRRLKKWIVRTLGEDIYTFSKETIEEVVGKKLRARHWTLSIAESCTGGGVSAAMTRVPGASRYFWASVVAYRDKVKIETLGVREETIQKNGAVSRQTALAMAEGVRKRFRTTLGVAVTGIAGPTGGTIQKPVGLVVIAIASAGKRRTWEVRFTGDRAQIQNRATKKVLEYLWRWTRH